MAQQQKSQIPYLCPTAAGELLWGPLVEGVLVRRYKRFLADVQLSGGKLITAHTPNTGTMLGCSEPGSRVWLSHHDSPSRKLKYTLELIETPGSLVGVNTGVPNRLVRTAIECGVIAEIPPPAQVKGECVYGDSRLDLALFGLDGKRTFVEIKNCTLAERRVAYFPDAVTARGNKHIGELVKIRKEGLRAILFILVQRADADVFSPADHIDPEWGRSIRSAVENGVEILVYQAEISLEKIGIARRLPVVFP